MDIKNVSLDRILRISLQFGCRVSLLVGFDRRHVDGGGR